ncbi:M48 family metalloprotease [Bordetella bronchialis]|uniref:Peptidase n=1 Tax=Bordetella bronchialis TaxID=463025 RepID=A0A193G550_9BORD|nr:M48 family metalloprotease [Bordetella bronchialis]ANN69440.1 peptidase [Bordetella bronchialis]ANN74586.1 peptidase [Bordetella bronchialis]
MLLLCASLSAAAPSATWAQPIGLPSMGAASADQLSPYAERQLGDVIMAEGRRDPTYISDPEINQYLTAMGRKLASFSPGTVPTVDLFGVRDPEINAFAMPGGYIGVNSGLVVATKSESELAAVLAHEIGHVVQRHIARGMTQSNQTGAIMLASVAGALLAALAGGGGNLAAGVAAFGQAAAIDRQLGFSRDAEREADRAGFQMLTSAGYNPSGMSHMFERLMNASRLNEGMGGGAWASTHPLSIDRMSDIENRVRNLPKGHHVDSIDYWYVRAKLRVIQGQDTTGLRTATQLFQDEARTLTGVQQSAAYYGLALSAMRREDLAAAESNLKLAMANGQSSPELDKLAVDLANAQKDHARALSLAEAAWKAWPGRYAIAIAYVQALQQAGRDAQAQAFLRERVKQWGQDEPQFYQLLAQSEERTGDRVQARRDMATYYTAIGALPAAEAQLRQAREMSRDFYVSSQIDVQIKEVRDKLDEQRQLLQRFKS